MKKFLRILIPILLTLAIIACSVWYLFVYDRPLTRDLLLACARRSESNGYHSMATWFYNRAYSHDGNSDAVAIELAQQYINNNNYTKAEYTLSNAISDGGGIGVYVKLCKTFVEQDKLIDAVNMLNSVTDPQIKKQLDSMRPKAPAFTPDPSSDNMDVTESGSKPNNEYNEYITVSLSSDSGTIYATTDGTYPTITSPFKDDFTMRAGVNVVRAVSVSDNGLVSTLGERKYVIHGVVEEVVFADPLIEAEIRNILGFSEEKKVLTSDLWTITEFTVPQDATKYDDLRQMIYLEKLTIANGISGQLQVIELNNMERLQELSITNTNVTQDELKLIAKIPNLQELTLSNTGLSGITPLKDAVKLTKLDISGNSVGVLDTLKYLTNLEELNLHSNAVTDLSVLSKNTQLRILDISENQVVSLAPLASLAGLTQLKASQNRISVLGDIGSLTELSVLYLDGNQLSSLSTIQSCTKITDLNLKNNQLTDISSLSSMEKLMYLDFSGNMVTVLPAFSKECALVTIDGSSNLLSDLSPLSGLHKLNIVNMQNNVEISSLEPLVDCHNLYRVNVLDTKVTEVRILTDKSISVLYRQPALENETENG